MEIKGTIEKLLPIVTGEGKNGTWQKQDFILKSEGNYPKDVCITMWGDKIEQFAIKEGESVTASIEIESREYNEKYYTNVQAWRIQKDGANQTPPPEGSSEDEDDLPF